MKSTTDFSHPCTFTQGEIPHSQINGDDLDNFLLSVSQEKRRLRQKNENPELPTQGFRDVEEPETPQLGTLASPSISYPAPASSEMTACETGMTYDTGHISIPRSLLFDDRLIDISPVYWRVFLVVCSLCRYTPGKYNDHGKIIDLKIGQCCVSQEELTEKCGKGVTRKHIRGAIKCFVKCEIWAQVRANRKTIITITDRMLYDKLFPCQGPSQGQSRAKAGPIKEQSNTKTQQSVAPSAPGILHKKGKAGEIRIDQSDILRELMIDKVSFSSGQFLEAWNILAVYEEPLHNAYLFVKQTLENLMLKEKSENIKTSAAKRKACKAKEWEGLSQQQESGLSPTLGPATRMPASQTLGDLLKHSGEFNTTYQLPKDS